VVVAIGQNLKSNLKRKEMKVTIELTDAEARGIKEYLKAVSNEIKPRITRADIVSEIKGIVSGAIYDAAMGDYVAAEVRKEKKLTF